jgi:hypothetical protein
VNYFQLNSIPAKDVPALLARADAMISVFAGFRCLETNGANKFFDGLAAGLPIIINYGGWQSAVVRDYNLGLVLENPLTEDDLLSLAEFLKNQRALAHARSVGGKVARSYLSRQKFEEHLQVPIEPYRQRGKERLLKEPTQLCSHPTCRDFLQQLSEPITIACSLAFIMSSRGIRGQKQIILWTSCDKKFGKTSVCLRSRRPLVRILLGALLALSAHIG